MSIFVEQPGHKTSKSIFRKQRYSKRPNTEIVVSESKQRVLIKVQPNITPLLQIPTQFITKKCCLRKNGILIKSKKRVND
jgi:hypothetical protein